MELEGFSPPEEKMIEVAIAALRGAGHDPGSIKLLVRAELPAGHAGMTLFAFGGAALGPEAFASQAMLNHVLEEELLHLQQLASGKDLAFGPGTAKDLEEAVHAVRKFPRPA